MSFFGFDPTGPPQSRGGQNEEAYDFENTYNGLDEADDALNDETFGGVSGDIGKDFDFGGVSSGAGAGAVSVAAPAAGASKSGISYAQAASSTNDEDFMNDLWGTSNAPRNEEASVPPVVSNPNERKVLSLEEIEAQLTAIDPMQQQQQQQQMQFHPQYGVMPPRFGYMMPPGGMMAPPPPGQFQQFGNMPMQMPPMGLPLQQQQLPIPEQQQQIPPQGQGQPPVSIPTQVIKEQNSSQARMPENDIPSQPPRKVDLSQFPVLGSKDSQHQQHQQQHQQQQQFQEQLNLQSQEPHHHEIPQELQQQQPLDQAPSHQHSHHHHPHHQQQQVQRQHQHQHHSFHQSHEDLTPEQQEKMARRQEKVQRIVRYSGIMNPKDKDFVTRFQLSQIVTEDPYNEDFYAQVFKVIHPKVGNNNSQQQSNNSIAQAYLEQSGHRLGGRNKRADVALQRMQQQVQKAVTVARERSKNTPHVKEGALGRFTSASGKKPRQKLEIISRAAQREKERAEKQTNNEEQTDVESSRLKTYSRKDILNILEDIIGNLMNVEGELRTRSDVDLDKLWESLRVLEQPSSSGDNESEVNPFIQCLSFNKCLKVLPRLFKFLNREQILTIVTLVMSNLENLKVIKDGSYTTYNDKKVPESITKLVDTYSLTFSKVLMNAVQDFRFNEIIGLLVILIEHNNVSFVSTTKIGLNILTTFLSRAELIRGEGGISATDLSEWSSCYDELFTSLESRIAAIFPPNSTDGSGEDPYIWQFLATLSLGGKLSHQRIIVDEVRDEIFGVMNKAKLLDVYRKQQLLANLNLYLVVMGLVADENEIKELS